MNRLDLQLFVNIYLYIMIFLWRRVKKSALFFDGCCCCYLQNIVELCAYK